MSTFLRRARSGATGSACVVAFGAIVTLAASDAGAQIMDPAEEKSEVAEQRLGDHLFQFPGLQSSAFTTTHVGMIQGIELLEVPNREVFDDAIDVHALGISERFEFGVELFDILEVGARGEAELYSGRDVQSLILGGAAYSYRGAITLGAQIARFQSTQLGLRGWVSTGYGKKLEVLRLVEALVADPLTTTRQVFESMGSGVILSQSQITAFGGSAHWAQALAPWCGLQVSAGLSRSDLELVFFDHNAGSSQALGFYLTSPEAAVALSVDAGPRFPIALMGEYSIEWPRLTWEESSSSGRWLEPRQIAAIGVYYSGRDQLQLGLSVSRVLEFETVAGLESDARPLPAGDPSFDALRLTLRYTW